MTTRTRRKIDAALEGEDALEALREEATVADLAQCYGVHPTQEEATPGLGGAAFDPAAVRVARGGAFRCVPAASTGERQ
jgi:hypothetical protein